jgi:hypothetical protein
MHVGMSANAVASMACGCEVPSVVIASLALGYHVLDGCGVHESHIHGYLLIAPMASPAVVSGYGLPPATAVP